MKLAAALVACNENPKYLEFWPVVKHAWWHVVGIPAIMVYVGEELPEDLKNDPAVIHFPPIPGWPTATQAQVIRLLYPALLKADGAVVISDMDIIPMQKNFFVDGFAQFREDQFVSLRGIDEGNKQVYMCYVGATPATWGKMFSVTSDMDICAHLSRLSAMVAADGKHNGEGWFTDQLILYNQVKIWLQSDSSKVGLIPWTAEIPRLDRANPEEWLNTNDEFLQRLRTSHYVDFHMPPFHLSKQFVMPIVEYVRQYVNPT